MKKLLLLISIFSTSIGAAFAGELPYNYFNLNFGIGNYKKPLIYTYSLAYARDINISKKSTISFGLEWDNFYQHNEYSVDTNFFSYQNPTGSAQIKYYYQNTKVMAINLAMSYKYWLKKRKTNSIYIESKFNIVFNIKDVHKSEYYYRDSDQTLHLGPYSAKYNEADKNELWIPDYLRPAISIGYLRNINKNMAYNFKLDLILAGPYQNPGDLAYLYPKLGFGLAFR